MAGEGGLSAADPAADVAERLPKGPVIVALSGGADSAALASIVAAAGVTARCVTVDHGLPASGALVAAAAEIAGRLGLDQCVLTAPQTGGSETELRTVRLRMLEDEAGPDELVLTAHTSDDQAETLLGNLFRGAGAAGLAGIPAGRGRFVRPMLGMTREEARLIAERAGLPFLDDPQNRDSAIRRNRIRLETIPTLEAAYNPALRTALASAAATLAVDDLALEGLARAIPHRSDRGAVLLPAAALATVDLAVAVRAVRTALRSFLDPYAGRRRDVEAVMAVATGASRSSLSGALLASREGPWVAIHPLEGPAAPPPADLEVPGTVRFGGWRIDAVSGGPPRVRPLGRTRIHLAGLGGDLVVRGAEDGDRIAIDDGQKAVAEALREAGAPVRVRSGWPVVEADGRIAWVAAVRAAAWTVGDGDGVNLEATREGS